MTDSDTDRDVRLNEIADEFAARLRRGERPSLSEYAARHPDLADDIREYLPAIAEVEQVKAAAIVPPEPDEAAAAPIEHFADFHILREIGRGGMGVVYEAEQLSLGRRVALKMLSSRLLRDARQKRRFAREAKAAARLHHTNIVPVFGSGEHDGTPYYVMQFIEGLGLDVVIPELARMDDGVGVDPQIDASAVARSLFDGGPNAPRAGRRTESDGSFAGSRAAADASGVAVSLTRPGSSGVGPGREARRLTYFQGVARIGMQVADALEYAHRQGIIHRDVKPSNLLLDLSGTAWVTDFGLAKANDQEDLTHTGDVLGTLRYMPPEAFEGRADARGDVYGLGVTLYELLALCPAVPGHDRHMVVKQVTTGEPQRLRRVRPEVPRDLETIVHKAIDRDPGRRYATAAELAEDLQRFLDDKPIRARRLTAVEHAARWCRRNPFDAALVAALLLAVLAGFAGVTWQWRHAVAARSRAEGETDKTRRAQEQTAAALYNSNIARARLEGQANNVEGAEAILDRCPPERRGWEWHFLKGLNHADLFTLTGHSGWVEAVAYSPDGRLIASAGGGNPYYGSQGPASIRPGEVILWDAHTGRPVRTLRGHTNIVHVVAFTGDGTRLVTASADRTARMWNVASGDRVGQFDVHQFRSVAFQSDGRRLAAGGEPGTIQVWPVAGGPTTTIRGHVGGVARLAFTSDGRRLAAVSARAYGSRGEVRVWDVAAGTEAVSLQSNDVSTEALAVSPDGRYVAANSVSVIKLWDLADGRLVRTLVGHQGTVAGLAFGPDGRRLASCGTDCTVRVWDVASGDEELVFRGHVGHAHAVAFSPDGERLASGGADGTVKVWDLTAHPDFGTPCVGGAKLFSNAEALAFADGHRRLVHVSIVNYRASVQAFDPIDGTVFDRRDVPLGTAWLTPAQPACLDAAGGRLAGINAESKSEAVCIDVSNGRVRSVLRGHSVPVRQVTLSGDGTRVATAGPGPPRPGVAGEIKVWDADSGRAVFERSAPGLGISRVALSRDGRLLAVAGGFGPDGGGFVKVYAVADGRELHSTAAAYDVMYGLAFDQDAGRLFAVNGAGGVLIWDLATGQMTVTNQGPPTAMDVAVSPDGRRLAVAGRTMTKLLDAATGEEVLVLRGESQKPGNTGGFNARVCWSPDGRALAVTGLSVWSLPPDSADAQAERRRAADRRALATHGGKAEHFSGVGEHDEAAARFHLQFVRDADLTNPWDLANRGLAFARLGDEARAEADLTRAAATAPHAAHAWFTRGDELAAASHPDRAKDCYARGLACGIGSSVDWMKGLVLFAHERDDALFRRDARAMFERFGGSDDYGALCRALWCCQLRPGADLPAEQLRAAAAHLAARATDAPDPWFGLAIALTDVRAGRPESALAWLDRAKPKLSTYRPWLQGEFALLCRALALHQLRQPDAARAALDEAGRAAVRSDDVAWHDRLAYLVLYREADDLLAGH